MRLIITLLLFVSMSAMAQTKVDSLKIPAAQVKKIEAVKQQLKELEAVRQKIQALDLVEAQLIEAAFEYKGLPVPKEKVFQDGVILYVKDKEEKPKK